MKICQPCGAKSVAEALTCAHCGEASWRSADSLAPVAIDDDAVPTPRSVAPVNIPAPPVADDDDEPPPSVARPPVPASIPTSPRRNKRNR